MFASLAGTRGAGDSTASICRWWVSLKSAPVEIQTDPLPDRGYLRGW